ncbi:MAG TPA: DUF1080 domain-containing protein [Pirellulales bacterium]|nr:DUF1080 domain-containing protein [Pirellulales bacterium]
MTRLFCCVLLAAWFSLTVKLWAADEKAADKNADEGWIVLFDGKSLDGWKASESPENWSVEEGAIVGQGSRSHLFYVGREFKNFHFKADVMINKGGNSGIFFHSQPEADWPKAGYESQVNNSHADPVKTGSLYYVVKVFESAAHDDEWWTQEIIVEGKKITMKVNGKTLYEYDEPEGVVGPHRLSQGMFAFQQHDPGSHPRFKNVKVKPLP